MRCVAIPQDSQSLFFATKMKFCQQQCATKSSWVMNRIDTE
jgi:hypothetical protein